MKAPGMKGGGLLDWILALSPLGVMAQGANQFERRLMPQVRLGRQAPGRDFLAELFYGRIQPEQGNAMSRQLLSQLQGDRFRSSLDA